MGELKRFDVEMNGDDLIIDEAPDGEWVRYEDADTLLSQVTIARAEVERLRGTKTRVREAELTSEVERLRAELDDESAERHEAESRECTLKGSLAAANALLLQSTDGDTVTEGWKRRRAAHLAAQPATAPSPAPRYALNFCSRCGSRLDCEECKEADARVLGLGVTIGPEDEP